MGLDNFFGSYLNQDFDLLHGTPEGCVAAFAQHQGPEEVATARRQLVQLLESTRSNDEALRRSVRALDCGWVPADIASLRALLEGAVVAWAEATASAV
jgi:hypothetical protein